MRTLRINLNQGTAPLPSSTYDQQDNFQEAKQLIDELNKQQAAALEMIQQSVGKH